MAKAIEEGRCAPAHMPSAGEALYGGCGMVSAAVVIGSFLSATTDATVPGVRVLVGVSTKNLKTSIVMRFNSQKVSEVSFQDDRLTNSNPTQLQRARA
jgi:hypothetical protein